MTQTTSTSKLELRLERVQSESNASKSYYLVIQKHNNLAIDCSCPHRVHRGRKCGRACKHMMARNNNGNQQRRESKLVAQATVKQEVEQVMPVLEAPIVVTGEEAMDIARDQMRLYIDQEAAEGERRAMQKLADYKLANAYGQLAPTIHVSAIQEPESCCYCGQRCKGGVCGRCAA